MKEIKVKPNEKGEVVIKLFGEEYKIVVEEIKEEKKDIKKK